MCKRRKGAVLAAAAEYLRGEGQEQGAFEVIVRGEGQMHRWEGAVEAHATPAAAEGALWLSLLAERVLAAIPEDGAWITTARIIDAAFKGREPADLRGTLRDLAARKILEPNQRLGFRRRIQSARTAG